MVAEGVQDHNPPVNKKRKTYIATFNVKSLANETRITELEYALSSIKWDILGICETRRQGYLIEDRQNYNLYLYGTTKGRNGVGFLVKKQSNIKVLDFIGITERVALIKVSIYEKEYTLAQVYAPTSTCDEKDLEDFYKSLEKVTELSTKKLFLLGDLNAKIGKPKEEESRATGKYGYGKRNKRGEKFIQFCLQNNLKIANTMFNKKSKLRWTWLSPNGKVKNEKK